MLIAIGVPIDKNTFKAVCLFQRGQLLRVKLIIMVHVVGQYTNFIPASENINVGRKSFLATINTV